MIQIAFIMKSHTLLYFMFEIIFILKVPTQNKNVWYFDNL